MSMHIIAETRHVEVPTVEREPSFIELGWDADVAAAVNEGRITFSRGRRIMAARFVTETRASYIEELIAVERQS